MAQQRCSHRVVHAHVVVDRQRAGGARLRESVALQNWHAEAHLQKLAQLARQRRRARRQTAQRAAQRLLHLVEHQPVVEPQTAAVAPGERLTPERQLDDGPLEPALLLEGVQDDLLHALQHARHRDEQRRLREVQVVHQVTQGAAVVADTCAHHQQRQLHRRLVTVRQRQVRENSIGVGHLPAVFELRGSERPFVRCSR